MNVIDKKGPWPFVTRLVYQAADRSLQVWSSRRHRKGLLRGTGDESVRLSSCIWMPQQLNWWIGTVFAMGSLLFAVASALSLWPHLVAEYSLDESQINAIFFAGSIPFTIAAYLQLFQAANAGAIAVRDTQTTRRTVFLGWRPHDIGWLSSTLQFIGTILFNFNTFDAMIPSLNWFQQDLVTWLPDIIGSTLFLASGYLAFSEICHAHWAWKPESISWWVVVTNLVGCVGFMVSAVFAIALPTSHPELISLSLVFTLLGAIGFLTGSLLMLPEALLSKSLRAR